MECIPRPGRGMGVFVGWSWFQDLSEKRVGLGYKKVSFTGLICISYDGILYLYRNVTEV